MPLWCAAYAYALVSALCLPRSGRHAVGLGASRSSLAQVVNSGVDMRVGERGLGHASKRLAGTWGLPVLLVRGNIEQDEEDEVGAEDTDASESGKLLSSAFTSARHVGKVSGREVSVRGEVDEACANRLVIMTGRATSGDC